MCDLRLTVVAGGAGAGIVKAGVSMRRSVRERDAREAERRLPFACVRVKGPLQPKPPGRWGYSRRHVVDRRSKYA